MSEQGPGHVGTQQDIILNRIGAFVLDVFVGVVVAFVVGYAVTATLGGLTPLGVLLGYFGYFIVLEGYSGQTLGKRAAGVIVVNRDGTAISFRESLIRNLLRFVDGLAGYVVGLVVMLVNRDRRRVGDLVAGTIVVEARRKREARSPHSRSSSSSRNTVR